MKKYIKKLINEIDKIECVSLKCIVSNFEKKIKKEIDKNTFLYGDNGGLDDYTLKDIDYVIFYYIWKYINISVTLEEILIIMYSFYKLEEIYFHQCVFCMSSTFNTIINSNINVLLFNILYIING